MANQPPVVASGEIVQMLGVGGTWARKLMQSPDFPAHIAVLGVGRIWRTEDVIAWMTEQGRQIYPIQEAKLK